MKNDRKLIKIESEIDKYWKVLKEKLEKKVFNVKSSEKKSFPCS